MNQLALLQQSLERIGAPIKAIVESRSAHTIPYSTYGSGGSYGGVMSTSAAADFYYGSSPGAKYDYRAEAGELMENPVVAVCVRAVADALAAAPPILEERQGADKWVLVPDDEVTGLLNTPMPPERSASGTETVRGVAATNGYGGIHLWGSTAAFECTQGQAMWLVEWNARRTKPRELRIENPRHFRISATASQFIEKYQIMVDGRPVDLRNDQVVHLRAALHHYNPRVGWCPLLTGHRQVAGENASATYHGALLRNHAAMSAIITLMFSPESANAAAVDPNEFEAVCKRLQQRYSGEGAGGLGYANFPLDVKKLGLNPEEMALGNMVVYYRDTIHALIGVNPIITGMDWGDQRSTYNNVKEAKADFWERRIQPTHIRYRSELGAQLLPLFGLDPAKYRLSFDYSGIDALNENADEKHARINKDYQAGVIDLWTAQTERGLAEVPEDYKGVFHPNASPQVNDGHAGSIPDGNLEDGSTPGEDDWTSEDDEKLEALWTTAQTDELLAQFSDRSEAEIAGRAETLGLKSFFFDELREVALKAERGELVGGTGSSHRGGHYEGAAAAEDESQEKKIAPLEERKRRRRRKDGLSYPVPEGLQMPREGFENGERGNSLWTPHDGLKNKVQVEASLKSYGKKGVMFRRGFPVLQPFIYRAQGENGRKVSSRIFMEFTGNRNTDFSTANTEYAKKLGWTKKNGKPDAARVERMRIEEGLTWHHVEDCKRQKMILVPTIIHEAAHHTGGHSLCTTE